MTFKTDVAKFVYNNKYRKEGEKHWGDTVFRVVNHVSQAENNKEEWIGKFYKIIYDRYFLPGGRILANAGTEIKNLMNCFYMDIEDSRQGIYETLKNSAEIFAHGGGLGYNFSFIREKGAPIKGTGGKASGPVSFMELFDTTGEVIEQASRRGAQMAILNIDHPDIVEFINMKSILSEKSKRFIGTVDKLFEKRENKELEDNVKKTIAEVLRDTQMTHFNISVGMLDDFMKAVEEDGDWELKSPLDGKVKKKVKARGLLKLMAARAWESGDPGVIFLDRVNEDNLVPYYGKLWGSNPCLYKDTIVLDGDRLIKIGNLDSLDFTGKYTKIEGGVAPVYSANNFYVWFTGNKDAIKLITNAGYEIILTPDHRIMLEDGSWIEAKDSIGKNIKWGIRDYEEVIRENEIDEKTAITGFLFGDGFLHANYVSVKITPEKEEEVYKLLLKNGFRTSGKRDNNTVTLLLNKNKFWKDANVFIQKVYDKSIPEEVFSWEINKVRDFLSGLFEANGSVNVNNQISFKTVSIKLAKDLQNLLLLFGIPSWISKNRPVKIKWKNGEYISRQSYNLQIAPRNAWKFKLTIGFISNEKNSKIKNLNGDYRSKLKVTNIENYGIVPVFDFKMKNSEESWNFASGFVCHNCGEIFLFDKEACNLGALNLPKFYDEDTNSINFSLLEEVIRIAVRFLDDVITVSETPLEEINATVRNLRRMGLGVMGWADLLALMEIPYNSDEAYKLANDLSWFITMIAIDESYKLGEEKGAFPLYKIDEVNFAFIEKVVNRDGINYNVKRPLRNVSWTAIQPTGSIALLGEVNSAIEPFFALAYKRNISFGEDDTIKTVIVINNILEEKLRKYGLTYKEIEEVKKYILENGTIKDAPHVPEKLQKVFITSKELTPEEHINMQSAWQEYISNSVSKTINMPNSASIEDVEKAFIYMWKKRLKGGTIYRDKSKITQVLY